MFNSFKSKIIILCALVILISFGVVAFFLDQNLEANVLHDLKSSMEIQAHLIAIQIPKERLIARDGVYLQNLIKNLSRMINARITVIAAQGMVLADSEKKSSQIAAMENHRYRPEVNEALAGKTGMETHYSMTLRKAMLYVAQPLKDQKQVIGVLRLALPLDNVQKILWMTRKTVIAGVLLALILAVLLGSVVQKQTLTPISRMIPVARRYAAGDFSRRIIRSSNDEIGELATTLNQMAKEIEGKIAEIEARNQQLATIVNSMVEGVIVTDRNGCILSVNPSVEKIFGVTNNSVMGRSFIEAIRNHDLADMITLVLKEGQPRSQEISLVLPVRKMFKINAAPILISSTATGCLLVIHDITEFRKLERIRQDFIANVSHELKTPLTSIKGFVETLLNGAMHDSSSNRNFLGIIRDQSDRLNSLVEDLLSLAHLESKEFVFHTEEVVLYPFVEKIVAGFQSQAQQKNLTLKNELPLDLCVIAERDQLRQIFTNLIDNAIKFNKSNGLVRIFSESFEGKIKITIADTGLGIPEKDIPRIFERFYRVDKARARDLGGTGLGLSIVKHIVELSHGSVGVESVEGLGSKFWFILPVTPS